MLWRLLSQSARRARIDRDREEFRPLSQWNRSGRPCASPRFHHGLRTGSWVDSEVISAITEPSTVLLTACMLLTVGKSASDLALVVTNTLTEFSTKLITVVGSQTRVWLACCLHSKKWFDFPTLLCVWLACSFFAEAEHSQNQICPRPFSYRMGIISASNLFLNC